MPKSFFAKEVAANEHQKTTKLRFGFRFAKNSHPFNASQIATRCRSQVQAQTRLCRRCVCIWYMLLFVTIIYIYICTIASESLHRDKHHLRLLDLVSTDYNGFPLLPFLMAPSSPEAFRDKICVLYVLRSWHYSIGTREIGKQL